MLVKSYLAGLAALLNHVGLDLGKLASPRKLVVGGAPIANETQLMLSQNLPQVAITQIYGQTELRAAGAGRQCAPAALVRRFRAARQPHC